MRIPSHRLRKSYRGRLPETQATAVQHDYAQITIQQAAKQLGYSEKTIRRLIEREEIRAVGRGRMMRIPISEIRAWQQRNGLGS